jgi:hypothetical protein
MNWSTVEEEGNATDRGPGANRGSRVLHVPSLLPSLRLSFPFSLITFPLAFIIIALELIALKIISPQNSNLFYGNVVNWRSYDALTNCSFSSIYLRVQISNCMSLRKPNFFAINDDKPYESFQAANVNP